MISQLEDTVSLFQEVQRMRVIGSSDAMRRVEREALVAAQGDANVLIAGERGVGKGVVARFIHERSDRAPHGFAIINCEGLPDRLFESELFGHIRGSFPGAYRNKCGLLNSVPGGTIFIDEVGALSDGMQALLLRFLETGKYLPVGGDCIQTAPNVRVIASTTADLTSLVAAGSFLGALHRRLNAVSLSVPPLRERRDDIPSLVDHFVRQFVGRSVPFQVAAPKISPEISSAVRDALARAEWPGNVGELKHAVLQQLLLAASGTRVRPVSQSV
jgi:two-component system response regulator HydG